MILSNELNTVVVTSTYILAEGCGGALKVELGTATPELLRTVMATVIRIV